MEEPKRTTTIRLLGTTIEVPEAQEVQVEEGLEELPQEVQVQEVPEEVENRPFLVYSRKNRNAPAPAPAPAPPAAVEDEQVQEVPEEVENRPFLVYSRKNRNAPAPAPAAAAAVEDEQVQEVPEEVENRPFLVYSRKNRNAPAPAPAAAVEDEQVQQVQDAEDRRCLGVVYCRQKRNAPAPAPVCAICSKSSLDSKLLVSDQEVPKEMRLCSSDCHTINSALQELVAHGEEELPDSLLNAIKKKQNKNSSENESSVEVKWRVINGKMTDEFTNHLLSAKIRSVFPDSVAPLVGSDNTESDIIQLMLNGYNKEGSDYSRMYCAILTVNDSVVSAGMFSIHGTEVAELPLVATSAQCQGQGYFQTLFSCIERFLASLHVRNLVLPAADGAESIWTNKFGFAKLAEDQINKYRKHHPIMIFQGTSLLWKPVSECPIVGT